MHYYFKESYKGWSPWGGVQISRIVCRGVKWVSTAGHGGLMITRKWGDKYLSIWARKESEQYKDYYCFEEDCAYSIPCLESEVIFNDLKSNVLKPDNFTIEHITDVVQRYYSEYWLHTGHTLTGEHLLRYNLEQELLNTPHNSPNLVIESKTVLLDHRTGDGYVLLTTADGKVHKRDYKRYMELRHLIGWRYNEPLLSWFDLEKVY